MTIENKPPPNYAEIKQFFKVPEQTFYTYGSVIYNPSGVAIPEDIIYHEHIHEQQQQAFGTPQLWWTRYLQDKDFRLSQELEAYAKQWRFIKPHVTSNVSKLALEEMATNLSTIYNVGLSYQQAFTMIRRFE